MSGWALGLSIAGLLLGLAGFVIVLIAIATNAAAEEEDFKSLKTRIGILEAEDRSNKRAIEGLEAKSLKEKEKEE